MVGWCLKLIGKGQYLDQPFQCENHGIRCLTYSDEVALHLFQTAYR